MACLIKICGVTTADDARAISGSGVDYLGVLVNVRQSPRSVSIASAADIIAVSQVPVIMLTYDHGVDEVLAQADALKPAGIQLAGMENEQFIATLRHKIGGELWKTVHLPAAAAAEHMSGELTAQINRLSAIGINRVVLDTAVRRGALQFRGGTGVQCDWSVAARIRQQVDMFLFLAGGINPDNARDALRQVNPGGIDLSSGVEHAVGKKDITLVQRLVAAAKQPLPHTPCKTSGE